MTIQNTRLLLLFIAFIFFLRASAQQPGYQYFKLEKDNRTIKINTLFKNKLGYLFAGTDNGLYKFDGEKYARIDFENSDYTDTVSAIFQDCHSKMWIGFKSGRIANVLNKKLQYYNPEEGTPKKKITAFIEDKQNNLWFSSNGEGIYFIRNNHVYLIDSDDGLSDVNVSTLALADNGDVLAGTDQGLNICNISDGKKHITVIGTRQGLPDYIVTTLIPAGDNNYWVGLQDKGFCFYNHNNKTITIPPVTKNWNYGQVNSMLLSQEMLWVATGDSGLYKYSPAGNSLEKIPHAVIDNNINGLLEDNQGNIWFSSFNYGMVRTPGETLKLLPVPGSPVFEHIHVILCDKRGNIWLNNKANELLTISFIKGMPVLHKMNLPGVNEKVDITSLYQDANHNIWVGTIGRGVFIVNPADFTYRIFTENKTFIDAGILSISGNGNHVYVSSLQGTMCIDLPENNASIRCCYEYKNYDNTNTGTNYIYAIFKDSKGRIWFGTDGDGLTMLYQNVFTYYKDKINIKDNRIYSITEDKSGDIWFSTANAGIYKFDGNVFTNYTVKDGLSDLNISVLKTDNAGNIIIVHKKGLDILDPQTGNISYLNNNMGISAINAEDLGAVTSDTSGNVMVSTIDGILTYSFPRHSIQKPTTFIESVQLFLYDINDSSSNVFDYDENNFTFSYTGLYYTNPEKVFYQYKLEGLDSSWIITKDRTKNFPKLAPGKYRFRIQSSLNKNFKNADEASYSFVIKQAFYKTVWFIAGCALLLVLLVYLYIKNREIGLRKIERMRRENIQFQFEVLRNQVNPHFLFNSFNTLISTIEDEPRFAVKYAEQLSEFFRNIVSQRDKDVISLKDEIESLHSYSFLQQKRYGDNLDINIELTDEQKIQNNIPPLTLQLLLENAIKHNALSKEAPLSISIHINSDNYLIIKNNRNPRISKQAGAGMGLHNIISRYKLLTGKPVYVKSTERNFTVSLPLLK